MTAGPRPQPSLKLERALWSESHSFVAGVDEVGRGPLAGPVFAAAVILNPRKRPGWLKDLRDSKELKAPERERLAAIIKKEALAYALGWSTVPEINGWGISRANYKAMLRALIALRQRPEYVLIDGPIPLKNHPWPQRAVVDGDATCMSIAAASIVAKVARDAVMCELDRFYPEYGFASHKGYSTPSHLAAIERHGTCIQHRDSWLAVQRRAALAIDAPAADDAPPEFLLASTSTETLRTETAGAAR